MNVAKKLRALGAAFLCTLTGASLFGGVAQAAQVPCTPTAGFTNCIRITYSGGNQTIVVPSGITRISAKVWGAAGAGSNSTYYNVQADGGAGGFGSGTITVTPGATLNLTVGQGGVVNGTASTFGGGGAGGLGRNAISAGSSGGGLSAIWVGAPFSTATVAILAAGGGGSSAGADVNTPLTGGGGGLTGGQDTQPTFSGRGGTQTAGGAAATGTFCAAAGSPTAGSQFQGGVGGNTSTVVANAWEGGGGGGGGYFGGGGGNCQNQPIVNTTTNGDGGGGSSFLSAAFVTGGATTAGANGTNPGTGCTGTTASGGAGDAQYTAGIGTGSCFANGGNGEIVLQWANPTVTISSITTGGTTAATFSGGNGFANQTITTVTAGTAVAGARQTLTNAATQTIITETIPAGYVMTGGTCTGLGAGGTATTNLAAGTITLDAAATAQAANIACTFTIAKLPTLSLTKVSNGGIGSFTFAGTNGWTSQTITTAAQGTGVTGATQTLAAIGTATTITETSPAGYAVSAIACSGLGTGGAASTTLGAGRVVLDAAATAAGANIACTYTNVGADMRIDLSTLSTTATVGVAYSSTYRCTNAAAPAIAATAAICAVTGLPNGLSAVCAPATPATVAPAGIITCTVSGTPTTVASSTVSGTTGATNDVNAANNTATTTIATTGADMAPDLTGLPATATVGSAYTGTVLCTNSAAATASALAASCAITGLPPGVSVGTCTPAPPATVAPGSSISCQVSGTPTAAGTTTATVTTGATNDTNGGAGAGGNNTATKAVATVGADMSPDLTGLPTAITVGAPYTGTIRCTNSASATAPATAATCSVSGLPAGVTVGTCTPAPPATVAIGASISCPVSGTPTSASPSTVVVTTGAPNDTNGGTTSGGNNSASVVLSPASSDMSISLAGLPGTASIGVAYTGTFTCKNAAAPAITATNAGCAVSGLPAGLTTLCTPTPPTDVAPGGLVNCTVSGTPTTVGSVTVTGTTGADNDPVLANNSATTAIAVTGSDMVPDLTGLPATATVGVGYTGTVKCTNDPAATASATSATCAVTGLPPGVTVGVCSPVAPATIAAGASIVCPVSGTPTASGTTTASVSTGATNDTNGGAGPGGNNTATQAIATAGSDMSISLAGLPPTASIGVAYSGSFKCTNAAAPAITATGATCDVGGLPAGLTTVCAPTTPADIAPGASITCTVSGTPTTVGTATLAGTTSASNDPNLANNTASGAIAVTGSDMVPDLSGLPATVQVGVPYTGTILCTNSATSTAPATAASCSVSALPSGLTLGVCSPVPPATVAVGASISCPVTGTPTSAAAVTVAVTTGATNDANGGTTTGGNNSASKVLSPTGSDMSISLAGLPTTTSIGVPYSGTYTCTNAASPAVAATAATCAIATLPAGLTALCSPATPVTVAAGGSITCTVSGTPTTVGTSTLTGTTGASNDPNATNNTAMTTLAVTGADMLPDLSGLPATATVGTAYIGTVKCTNAAAATASALSATCAVTGLPPGVAVGTCSPAPPASVAAGSSIVCPVSGIPTASGSTTATVTTGATNDTNGGTGTGGNNTATQAIATVGSDMAPDLTGLPTLISVGTPYTGTIKCMNSATATADATLASCSVTGLPAGLSVGVCTPAPPATVAAGASISCPVTGTPTSAAASTVVVTTGAPNDTNGGTTTGGNNSASKTLAPTGSDMTISLGGLPTTASIGVAYSGTFTCSNAAAPAIAATNAICAVSGLPAGLTTSCSPTPPATIAAGAAITCTVTGTPTTVGTSTLAGTTGAANDTNPTNNTASTTVAVTGSDMTPDLTGLPATATVGTPYTGTIKCTNDPTATASAANASCAVTGLPPGVTVGICTPTPPATIAAGASIICPVSGTPTAPGTTTATVTTGATNDVSGGTTAGGNNSATQAIATVGSDMAPDLTGLPTVISVGVAYTGTVKCTNSATATAAATVASCSVSGLPTGLSVGVCSPVPPASVAIGASISCPVTGTPTSAATSVVTVTTGATNDTNGGTTTGGNNSASATLSPSASDMSITLAGLPVTASVGVPYSGTFSCSNAAAPAIAATAATCAVTGLPAGLSQVCVPVPPTSVAPGGTIACTVSGTPTTVGTQTVAGTTSATNDPNTSNNTASTTIAVTGSDMVPDLSGLPATATIGTSYIGSIRCTNTAGSTAGATNASCAVTGLPPGVTVGACSPVPPATVPAGSSIVCPVTGTPTAVGTSTVSVATGATNDTNGGTGPGGNNTATKAVDTTGSDMSISLTGLPATASIGTPYSGSFTCSNAAAPAIAATAASCAVTGLPAGLTTSCSPIPPTSVAPGANITCTVTGTPTASGTSTLNGTTGAGNDGNPANNTATASLAVTGSDMTPDLSGLPTAVVVGTPYTGTILCTNSATATAAATAASCAISGLPAGVAAGVCTPAPPATVAAGASISCPVSGTPTSAAPATVTVITGATNDENGGTTSGGNNTATKTLSPAGSDMAIDVSLLPTTASVGVPYSGTYTCSNAAAPAVAATGATCELSTLPAGLTKVCSPTTPATVAPGASISCTVSGTPTTVGSTPILGTTGAGNDTVLANNTVSTSIAVTGSDLVPDLTGLPTTLTVGSAYTGTILCTNSASATANAISATCSVSGLPPGLTVGTCVPATPASLTPGQSISCPVTGTPTAPGASTVTVVTGAVNDTNGGTTAGGNNTATATLIPAGSDMSIDLAGLPTAGGVGQPYTGSFTCTNAAAPAATATAASCAVGTLPAGLTAACSPTTPATVAPGAKIVCTVTGTPTTPGTTTVAGTTGATNDGNPANDTASTAIAIARPALTVVKTAPATPNFATAGKVITYSYAVTNSGPVTVTAPITVSDNKIATVACPALPTGGLAPGATLTCSGTYTTTQVDVDAGGVTNIASAKSGTTTSPTTSLTVPAVTTAGLAIVKSTTATGFATAGAAIVYQYKVTNTGNTTITSTVTVADNKIASVSCPSIGAGLVPSASITCSGSYTTTQADVDAGGVTNTATASSGTINSAPTSLTVPATQTASLSVVKTSTATQFATVGSILPYSYKVTNTGNTTVTAAITVTDNKIAAVTCPSVGGGLAPGANLVCTGSYTVTQADIDAGGVTNTAQAKSGTTTSPPVSLTVPSSKLPAMTIAKSSTATGFASVGTIIPYSYLVTNTGNVTITTAITVSDNKIASVSCPSVGSGLAPGASLICTGSYTTTQADIDAGGVTNVASSKTGTTTSPPTTLTVPATQTRSLSLAKSSTATSFNAAGVAIPYSYVVRNTGNTTIPSTPALAIADNKIATVACPAIGAAGLAPGASLTCTATGVTTQADVDAGSLVNTATASAGGVTSPLATTTVTATQTSRLTLVKNTTSTGFSAVGVIVPYSFTATNAGNTTITAAITVSDSRITAVSCPALGAGLAPGASIICTGTYTTTQADLDAGAVTNTATATSGTTTSPPTSHTLTANQSRALSITKSASPTTYSAVGTSIGYSYVVTNAGNTTLPAATRISVSDNKLAAVACPALPAGGLAPGASVTCTASYVTRQSDIDAGSITNIATATDGTATSPSVSATVTGLQSPALTIAKATTATAFATVGQSIPYTFKVTNSGNITLTAAVTVTDSRIASVSCPSIGAGLAPAASITCTGSYAIKQSDLDAGSVINVASAKSGSTTSPTDQHTLNATTTTALSVAKSSTATVFTQPGVTLPYSYKVTNTGNVTITSAISVSDNRIATVICPALPAGGLTPAAFITCTGSYVTTQADVDTGGVTNAAAASTGTTTSPTTTLTVPSTRTPALTLAKTTTATSFAAVGETIAYAFTVTNSGNTTVAAAITITDPKIGAVTCPALPAAGLAPGAALTCSGSYTVIQADLDAGQIVNTATAKSGTTTSPSSSVTLPAVRTPALTVVKSSTVTSFTAAGQSIPYSYKVTNTGNVTLTSAVSITDSKIASVSCPSIGSGLAPGAAITCTASYTTTQADVDAGGVTNTATAKSGTTTSPQVSVTVTSTQIASLKVVKSTTATTYVAVGDIIPYTYVVTNTGNVTLTSAVTVTDSKIPSVSCPSIGSGLVPSASITCSGSYTITQADIDGGNVINAASAKSGIVTSPTVTFPLTGTQIPKLTIVKSSTTTAATAVGQSIPYVYTVTNTGNTTIKTQISITDSKIGGVSCPAIGAGLAVGASQTCTANYSVTQPDLDAGNVVNTAVATSGTIVSNTAALTIPATQSPNLTLIKSAPPAPYTAVGQIVPYTFAVTNTGNVTVATQVTIADDRIASVTCPALPAGGLTPGLSINCTGSYTITQADIDAGSVVNTATAKAGTTISTPPQVHTQPAGQTRTLTVTKTPSTTTYASLGASVGYTYVVRNTGNVTIPATAAISVSDNKIASVSCPAIPGGGLGPNATLTCTGSYVITQADLDAGSVTNTARATDGTVTSATVSATITATQTPSISLTKSTTTTSFAAVGTAVPYTFTVQNTGNVTIKTAVTVADNRIAAVTCPSIGAGLIPGAALICTGTYATTQADLDAGTVVNTATAKSGATTSNVATHALSAAQSRALAIAKSAAPTTFAAPGVTIAYAYVVTNTGNVTIPASTAISVADNKLAGVSCPALPAAGLAPTRSITCTASTVTTQADVDAGSISNTASATDGVVTSPLTSTTVTATQSPSMSVVKATTSTIYSAVGTVIPYTFVVTNSGNTTLTQAITVSDNKIASVACPSIGAGLVPGAKITCTGNYTITQADIDSGSVVNTAFSTSGPTVSTPPTTHILNGAQTAALTLVKSSTATGFSATGATLAYRYKVTNSGNVTLTSPIVVADDRIAAVACPALPAGGLVPGAFITCTASYTTTQADLDAGRVVNTATAQSGATVSPKSVVTVPATQSPALTIVKATTAVSYATVGTAIPYTYKVTNAGNVTLTAAVTVADNKIASVTCPPLPAGGIAPGASTMCTGTYTTTQADLDAGKVVNIASATSGTITSPTSTVTVTATQTPALSIVKSSTTASFAAAGTLIPYSYKVTNAGNVTLTSAITVSDNKVATVSCPALPAGGLVPGASLTCTGSYTTTQADVDAGSVANTASAKSGATTSPTTSLSIPSTQAPALTLAKTSTTTIFSAVGVSIPYSYKVTNAGNTTLTSAISVTDDKIAAVSCPSIGSGLLPAASITCTGTYVTTQADVDAGLVVNTASAKSGTVTSPPVTLSISSTRTPALALVKSTTSTGFTAAGMTIPYSYKVTNTGNTTLIAAITIADDKIAAVTCPALPTGGLVPAAVITCSGTYVTTQADVDAGSVVNIASAKSGAVMSTPSTVTVRAQQTPAIAIAKSSTTTGFSTVGALIPYSYKVTNTGNTTLTAAITVTDNKIASVTCPALAAGGLTPGAFVTCTASYITVQADLDAGNVVNTARAASGTLTSAPATLTIVASQAPALTIAKTSTVATYTAIGVVIPYSYKVTNTGNTTLTSAITVTDNKIATVTCPALAPAGLVPGAFVTCTGNYTTTQADLDAGTITNTAAAKSGTLTSPTVTLTITATQTPALAILKTSTATSYVAVGDVLPYSYKVTNAGNVTLTAPITVADNKIASVACPALPAGGLLPTAFITCTGTYTVTQADLDSGTVTNTAQAKSGTVQSPVTTLTIKGTQKPDFKVTKTTSTPTATNNGDGTFSATFRVVLVSTGNVDLKDVQMTDDYGGQLPAGGVVTRASIKSMVSSTRGALTTANALYTATSASPNLLTGAGETLAVAETITAVFDITFDPGPITTGASFNNTVVAKTIFNAGTTIAVTASRTSAAVLAVVPNTQITVTKTTPKADITRGELVPYTISVRNPGTVTRTGLTLVDTIPAGFKYKPGSATIDGVAKEPTVNGRVLSWANVSITTTRPLVLRLVLVAGAGLGAGEFVNEAWVTGPGGTIVSSVGRATVRMVGDPNFDCTDIIGRVFDDADRSGYADDGKRGIANVRLATARGQLITTDNEGRYHIACADIPESDRGTNFILKLDERTLPTGYRLTTENPRVIRITAGKMGKINFGASIMRVARMELADAAFEPGTTKLLAQWESRLWPALEALKSEPSVLHIAYRRNAIEDPKLSSARVKALAETFKQAWPRYGAKYKLTIETEVFAERSAKK